VGRCRFDQRSTLADSWDGRFAGRGTPGRPSCSPGMLKRQREDGATKATTVKTLAAMMGPAAIALP
jgi:hypothetical protein